MGLTKEYAKLNIVVEFMLVCLGVWSAVNVFMSAFEIKLMGGMGFVYWFAVAATVYGLFKYMNGRVLKYAVVAMIFVAVIVGIVGGTFLQYSAIGLLNAMDIGVEFDEYIAYDFFMIYIFTVIGIVMSVLFAKGRKLITVLCLLPGLIPCIVFGKIPSAFALTVALIFIIGISIYSSKNATYTLGVVIAIVVLYFAVIIVFPAKEHKGNSWFDKLMDYIEKEDVLPEQVAVGGISGGELGNVDKLEFKNIKMLTLQTGFSGNLYLKGFSGSVYSDNRWNVLDGEVYNQYKAAFDSGWNSINLYNQQAQLFGIIDDDGQASKALFGSVDEYFNTILLRGYIVKYEATADNKYWYMPYGNCYSVSNKSEKDGYPLNCEKGYISSSQYIYKDADYDKIATFLEKYDGDNVDLQAYIRWEKEYRKFVYNVYTEVDADVKKSIASAKVAVPKAVDVTSSEERLAYAAELKEYFANNFEYNLAPGAVPQGRDFFDYFLTETNRGYCIYFATAATLMLRDAGIPARYVEGYCVDTQSDNTEKVEYTRNSSGYKTVDKYTQYTVDVYDNSAHAWVEIYMDGYGWVPYEFTPGFTNNNITQGGDISLEEKVEQEQTGPTFEEIESAALERETLTVVDYDNNLKEYLEHNRAGILNFNVVFRILWKEFLRFLKVVTIIAAILAVICVIIYIPSHISARKNRKMFEFNSKGEAEEDAKKVREIYIYLEKLCRFLKIKRTDTMAGEEYLSLMKSQYEYFKEAGVENIVYAIEKLSYGRGNIGREQMRKVVSAASEIHEKSYKELRLVKKLMYRFIWHLY